MPKLLLPLVAALAIGGSAAGASVYLLTRDETVVEVQPSPIVAASPAPTAEPTATPEPSPGAPADWATYTDATYGYSFDYPATWFLFPPGKNGGDLNLYSYDLVSVPPEQAGMPVPRDKLKAISYVAEGVDKPLEQWLADARNDPAQPPPPTLLSTSDVALGGKTGLAQVVEDDYGVKHISYYLPLGGGRILVIGAVPADSVLWPQFEKLLASLHFAP